MGADGHDGEDPHGGNALVSGGTPIERADAAVVLVHGRGATARSILGFGDAVAPDGVALLAPEATGHSWYPHSFLAPVERNEPGLSSGLRAVGNAIAVATAGDIDEEGILVTGFSQGACLASEYVARNPTGYGGLAVLSGGLIGESAVLDEYMDGWDDGPLAGTPVFLGCSDVDPHIPEPRVHETASVLEALGGDVTTRIYEGMGHTISDAEVERVSAMIERVC